MSSSLGPIRYVIEKGEKFVAAPMYIGVFLLMVNKRVGWDDAEGPNLWAILLRPDGWVVVSVIAGLLLMPFWRSLPKLIANVYKPVLMRAPVIFIASVIFASLLNCANGYGFADMFGLVGLFNVLECFLFGVVVFRVCMSSGFYVQQMVDILKWSSVANILVGVFTIVAMSEVFPGIDKNLVDAFEFMSPGERFQGLGSNPYILATQSNIALAFLIAELTQTRNSRVVRKFFLCLYGVCLAALVIWTGVRAALVVWPAIFAMLLWFRVSLSREGLLQLLSLAMQGILSVCLLYMVVFSMGLQQTMLERLGSEDGRLFLWLHYAGFFIENPLGAGLAFETIAQSESITQGQRLPPHNALLQAAMYGGIVGLVTSVFLVYKGWRAIKYLKLRGDLDQLGVGADTLGVCLAWVVVVVTSMFVGLLQADLNFSILMALLLSIVAKSRMNFHYRPASTRVMA